MYSTYIHVHSYHTRHVAEGRTGGAQGGIPSFNGRQSAANT